MRTKSRSNRLRSIAAVLATLGLSAALGCGGGESVISGLGNSNNNIGPASLWESLADRFSDHAGIPAVSDEEIGRIYQVIRDRALDGDPVSALVVLKLAEAQRLDE